jgi:hypothetical protein
MEINYIAIISSILINILKRFSSKLSLILVSNLNKNEVKEISQLKNEINNLYKERDSYNQIDEFANYALVDRKINKLQEKLQAFKNIRRKNKMSKIMYMNISLTLIMIIMSIFLIWSNRNTPIIEFSGLFNDVNSIENLKENENSIFYPLSNLFSFPCTNKSNSVGFTIWLFIVNRLFDIIFHKFGKQDHISNKNNYTN